MAIAEQDSRYSEFGFEVSVTNAVTLVELAGELDLATAPQLRECLVLPEVFDAPAVRVDLTNVTFFGSTGIGLLVAACKRARAAGASFSVTGGRGIARQVIEVSGLVDYFEVH
jgi:anti-sigma B factor antagonist